MTLDVRFQPSGRIGFVLCAAFSVLTFGLCHTGAEEGQVSTVSEILQDPSGHDGKLVTVRGTVESGFELSLLIDTEQEGQRLWIDWPASGPNATVSTTLGTDRVAWSGRWTEFALVPSRSEALRYLRGEDLVVDWQPWPARASMHPVPDKNLKRMRKLVRDRCPCPKGTYCVGTPGRYAVQATVKGRFEHVPGSIILRDGEGHRGTLSGFGHMSSYNSRLVAERVMDVQATRLRCE